MTKKYNVDIDHSLTFIRKEISYAFLIISTVVSIFWQHYGMEKSYTIRIDDINNIRVGSDNINGGKSVSNFKLFHNKIEFHCEIKDNPYTFSYCGLNILLGSSLTKGMNVQEYDSLEFTLKYESSKPDTLLIYLSNNESMDSTIIERANMHTFNPKKGIQQVKLELNNFAVPSWWIFMLNNEGVDGERRLNNVTELRIVSGDSTVERTINLSLSDIVLKGKWIKANVLYLSLLVLWVSIISLSGLFSLMRIREKYSKKAKESKELKQLNDLLAIERNKFENLAKTDFLTNCLNRVGLRDFWHSQIQRFDKMKEPCSIILLDVDHFKKINDQYGHDEGDIVLVNLVDLIKKNIRVKDQVARWGGEEFLITCPGTSIVGAIKIAEFLRGLIEDNIISKKIKITCSFGVSQLASNQFEPCLKQADLALYKAKSLGRNNVQFAEGNC